MDPQIIAVVGTVLGGILAQFLLYAKQNRDRVAQADKEEKERVAARQEREDRFKEVNQLIDRRMDALSTQGGRQTSRLADKIDDNTAKTVMIGEDAKAAFEVANNHNAKLVDASKVAKEASDLVRNLESAATSAQAERIERTGEDTNERVKNIEDR